MSPIQSGISDRPVKSPLRESDCSSIGLGVLRGDDETHNRVMIGVPLAASDSAADDVSRCSVNRLGSYTDISDDNTCVVLLHSSRNSDEIMSYYMYINLYSPRNASNSKKHSNTSKADYPAY